MNKKNIFDFSRLTTIAPWKEAYMTNRKRGEELLECLHDSDEGTQKEFLFDSENDNKDTIPLFKYGRVWVYTQGIALDQAVRISNTATEQDEKDKYEDKAHSLARWLYMILLI